MSLGENYIPFLLLRQEIVTAIGTAIQFCFLCHIICSYSGSLFYSVLRGFFAPVLLLFLFLLFVVVVVLGLFFLLLLCPSSSSSSFNRPRGNVCVFSLSGEKAQPEGNDLWHNYDSSSF